MKKGKDRNIKLLPNSLRIISSCIKTVSTNAASAVRSASASVATSIAHGDDQKEQVLWAGFDKFESSPNAFRRVLLLGYLNGFQIFDVEDASGLIELVSTHDGPATFLQMLPAPGHGVGAGKYKLPHPMVVVAGFQEDEKFTSLDYTGYGHESSSGSSFHHPSSVRFYSMKSNEYVRVIDFRSAVLMLRCNSRIVAIGLEEQIYCFDTLTLEKKFIVVTYPVPQLGEPGALGMNTGYGPMALGTRWLAYPPNRPFLLNSSRVSPKSVSSSVSPSTSPGSGTMMARYAVESCKHLAVGVLALGDMGYKKLSKYCPELRPDSCDSPGWKTGKLAACEPENAGMVAVKDLVCSEVISQFRAHTSPISALCFDPSGTLLVTSSVHGNSINIFRIMPSHKGGGSGFGEWSTYVHLYKLYRGMTSAVIQDICFSQYSQWVGVLSSRGTCHIFALSPFGSNDGIQSLHAYCQGSSQSLIPSPPSPWWSTSSFTVNERPSLPPPTCTLSVVTRIRCNDYGLLNSVSNAAASMVGKTWVPSGAAAAIFHNSNFGPLDVKPNCRPLEHILVYTPSGFLVQHEIFIPMVAGPQACAQNEELKMKVEPVQWWDVCRRLDDMEREDSTSGSVFDEPNELEVNDGSKNSIQDNVFARERKLDKFYAPTSSERSQWYLSNAEVQIKSCRLPIWKNPMMNFHVFESPQSEYYLGGEFEIEMAPSHEVDTRHRDLLPIFENFRRLQPGLIERSIPSDAKHTIASTNCCQTSRKANEAGIICHSKLSPCSATESSEGGPSRRIESLLEFDHMSITRSPVHSNHAISGFSTIKGENNSLNISPKDQRATAQFYSESNADDNATMSSPSSEVYFARLCKEGYCNEMASNDHRKDTENTANKTDRDGNAHEEESSIGGMFDFSEEAAG